MYKTKIILLSFLIIVSTSCKQLTPEQAFVQDFANVPKPSVAIDTLLNSSHNINIENNHFEIYSFFDNNNIFPSLKVYVNLPSSYELKHIWFIYSYSSKYSINNKYLSTTETAIFPEPKLDNKYPDYKKYYEFYNIKDSVRTVVVQIKKDSQIYYLSNYVYFSPEIS